MGASADFTDGGDKYTFTNSTSTNLNDTAYTFCAWFYWVTNYDTGIKRMHWMSDYELAVSTKKVYSRTGGTTLFGTSTLNQFQWYFLAMTHDAAGSGTARVYVDGVEENSVTRTPTDNVRDIRVSIDNTGFNTDGLIAYPQIFTKQLSVDELNEVMYHPWAVSDSIFWRSPLTNTPNDVDVGPNGFPLATVTGTPVGSLIGPSVYFPQMKG